MLGSTVAESVAVSPFFVSLTLAGLTLTLVTFIGAGVAVGFGVAVGCVGAGVGVEVGPEISGVSSGAGDGMTGVVGFGFWVGTAVGLAGCVGTGAFFFGTVSVAT